MANADPVSVLADAQTVAVVGCSTNAYKAAHRIPAALQDMGFTIWPVHPTAEEVLGVPAVPLLAHLADAPDLVVVFRPSEEAADVTRQAIERGARGVWLQQGITSPAARHLAEEAGIPYVEDRCSMVVARQAGIRK